MTVATRVAAEQDLDALVARVGKAQRAFAEYSLEQLDHLAEDAFDDQCTGTNPRFPLISELRALLVASYYGEIFREG